MDQCITACCFEYQTRLGMPNRLHMVNFPRSAPVTSEEMPPHPSPQAAREPLRRCLTAAPAALSWHSTAPAEAPFRWSSAPPHARMQNLWLQQNTKEARDLGADIGFSNPKLLHPETLFGCVTVARRGGGCSCRIYFHPVQSFFFYYTWSREQTPKQSRAVSRLAAYPREGPNILSTLGTGGGGSPVSGAMKAVFYTWVWLPEETEIQAQGWRGMLNTYYWLPFFFFLLHHCWSHFQSLEHWEACW